MNVYHVHFVTDGDSRQRMVGAYSLREAVEDIERDFDVDEIVYAGVEVKGASEEQLKGNAPEATR